MKMRIRGNSLRLRITRGEVDALVEKGAVEETVSFGAGVSLPYRLRVDEQGGDMTARLDGSGITVSLPAQPARDWARSEEVSLASDQRIADGEVLRILVEKDFACLVEREGEDDSDAFPHPKGRAC